MNDFFVVFAIVIFGLLVFLKIKQSEIFGKIGESGVGFWYLSLLPKEYHTLNDLLLEKQGGGTVQIDHVVVSPHGIFVIETKTYEGLIIGSPWSKQWRQYLGRRYYPFHNPLHQNYGHIKTLEALFPEIPTDTFVSIIAFHGAQKIDIKGANTPRQHVVHSTELRRIFKSYPTLLLGEENINKVVEVLSEKNILDKKIAKKHRQEVRRNLKER